MGGVNAATARILFVDDEPHVRATFARIMKGYGFNVDLAESGAEALRLAELYPYPIVVTDLCMPEIDGVSLIRKLHLNDPATVFIIVTGACDVQVPTDLQLRDHVASIVSKPFEVKELAETLHRSIRLYRSRTSASDRPDSHGGSDTILLVEDDNADADLVEAFLLSTPHRGKIRRENRLQNALNALEEVTFGVIITDLALPDARGLDAVLRIQNVASETPLLVLTSQRTNGVAVQALQAGAQDFLLKDGVDARTLVRSIQYARERKRSEQDLAQLAHFDPLTGLPNRTHFSQFLESTLSRARRAEESFAVLFLDLDGFKPINDEHGHAAGDTLLIEVSRRLEATLRETDIVARLGGDEFAVVLDRLSSADEAPSITQRMLDTIRQPYTLGKAEVRVSASIGIALYPEDGTSACDLVKAADHAMYAAKRRGRNTFEAATSAAVDASGVHVSKTSTMRRLGEELCLSYKPRIDYRTSQVVALEGVIGWKEGDLRPVTEEALRGQGGDSERVNRWLLVTACHDLRRLQEETPEIRRVSLELSQAQLFGEGLRQALDQPGVEASSLEFTIPGTALSRRPNHIKTLLSDLHKRGVHLAVAGVGAERASLLNLCSLPFDVFKLDPRFAQGLLFDAACRAALIGILSMAKELGVIVVASGVDTPAQADALLNAGCETLQGAVADEQVSLSQPSGAPRARTA